MAQRQNKTCREKFNVLSLDGGGCGARLWPGSRIVSCKISSSALQSCINTLLGLKMLCRLGSLIFNVQGLQVQCKSPLDLNMK